MYRRDAEILYKSGLRANRLMGSTKFGVCIDFHDVLRNFLPQKVGPKNVKAFIPPWGHPPPRRQTNLVLRPERVLVPPEATQGRAPGIEVCSVFEKKNGSPYSLISPGGG